MDVKFVAKKILVPVDFHEKSLRALQVAADLAVQQEAELRVLHVMEGPSPVPLQGATEQAEDDIKTVSAKMLADLCRQVLLRASIERELAWGSPAEVIAQRAEEWGADLIVMGTSGRKGLSRIFLGSVAEAVVRSVRRPILLLPEDETPEA
jgi:nucleotide-binding universal stress UspA family protein